VVNFRGEDITSEPIDDADAIAESQHSKGSLT
jgi:hypothetical protein